MRTLPFIVAMTTWPVLLASAEAPTGRARAGGTAAAAPCSAAAIADVRLPAPVAVDEIRVVVADRSPAASAASVRVDAGAFDRILRLRGPASHALEPVHRADRAVARRQRGRHRDSLSAPTICYCAGHAWPGPSPCGRLPPRR
jgi:hypothetical protein